MQALFARHYFYFAALATLGALQIAISIGGYRSMWLIPNRLGTRVLGIMLIAAGIALFFLLPLWVEGPWAAGSVEADSSTRLWGKADWGDLGAARNVNDVDGGLSGTGQATWFPLAALIAGCVSVVAGAINRKLFPSLMRLETDDEADPGEVDGLALMKQHSYFGALARSWPRFKRDLPSDASKLLARSDGWSVSVQVWRRYIRRDSEGETR